MFFSKRNLIKTEKKKCRLFQQDFLWRWRWRRACIIWFRKNTSGSCCFLSASAFMPLTESAIWAIFCLRLLQATVLQGWWLHRKKSLCGADGWYSGWFPISESCLFKVCQFYNTESDFIVFGISSGISAWKAFNCDAAWNFFLYIPDNELRDRCLSEKIWTGNQYFPAGAVYGISAAAFTGTDWTLWPPCTAAVWAARF